MQRKMVALISTPFSLLINTGKQERYEFLIESYPDEQTAQGYVKPTWQDTYMHTIIQQTSYSSDSESDTRDSIFMINNPSLNLLAWQWFTVPEVEYKTKMHTQKHTAFVEEYAWDIIKILVKNAAKFSHGCMQWKHVPLYLRIQELLVQAIIWPKLGSKTSIRVLDFITDLMSITFEMKYEIGNYAKALISNTDCIHPMQVELCFEYLRKWISKCVISAGDHLLPDTFCYQSLIKATDVILHQKDWQIICVYFSFILHHSRLLNDHYRDCIFREYLLEKELFKNFFCHWNTKLRKYYYMVLLYCVNRVGYFDEQRRNKYIRELNASQMDIGGGQCIYSHDMLESGHRIHVLFDNLAHLVGKQTDNKQKKSKFFPSLKPSSMSSLNLISMTNQKLSLVDKKGRKISWASIVSDDERNEMQNLLCFSCNMCFLDRLESDRELMEMLNLEITKLKSKRKSNIEEKYRPYLDASFRQFSELCERYSMFQLTVNCQKWQFGDVVIPTLIYKVRKHNQILDEFLIDTQNIVNGKFVQ